MVSISKRDVRAFRNICLFARSVYQDSIELYEIGESRRKLLANASELFFGNLNKVLIEYNILQVCKLTDPKESFAKGSKKENLTIKLFIEDAALPAANLKKLKILSSRMDKFREKLKDARNRNISHLDRQESLRRRALGVTTKRQWTKFWDYLDEFLFIISEHYLKDPFHINKVARLSGVDSLVKSLKQSTYFDELVSSNNKDIVQRCYESYGKSEYRDV